ncbi:MAG TPA: HD domain-containing protein [Candidatus Agathobaculum pullicola]|nr:HD domain-containing protein [Candidatus Agathobaculum pullicola]
MISLPAHAARAIAQLENAGYETWAVGGCVRDSLRGAAPHDWDLCTAAKPAQMQAVFAGERVLETGLKHGTLTILTDAGPLEITTFRADGSYSDGRHPDGVRFVPDVTADLARRDFTVGAMAWHPKRGLCDPFGGRDDLQSGVLRAVGDPDARFQEDALRILRGVRFASQLGFAVETQTAAAMRRQVGQLACVAAERIREELTGMLCGRFVIHALRDFPDILTAVLPEFSPMVGCAQQNPYHLYDVWEHSARAVGQVPAEPCLRWAMLLHDCGKPACKTVDENGVGHFYGHPRVSRDIAASLMRRLRFSSEQTTRILLLVEQHDRPLGDSDKLVRRRLVQIGQARFRDLLAIKKGDAVGQGTHPENVAALWETERRMNTALAQDACLSLRQLAVNGNDMTALGLRGPAVGAMLHSLLDAVVDGTLDNTRQALLAHTCARMEEQNDQ